MLYLSYFTVLVSAPLLSVSHMASSEMSLSFSGCLLNTCLMIDQMSGLCDPGRHKNWGALCMMDAVISFSDPSCRLLTLSVPGSDPRELALGFSGVWCETQHAAFL